MEIQAAMAAVRALVEKLGPFLSPYLGNILALLLHPSILQPEGTIATAADMRTRLSQCIPSRLLLPALLGHLQAAVQVSPCIAQSLNHIQRRLVLQAS